MARPPSPCAVVGLSWQHRSTVDVGKCSQQSMTVACWSHSAIGRDVTSNHQRNSARWRGGSSKPYVAWVRLQNSDTLEITRFGLSKFRSVFMPKILKSENTYKAKMSNYFW